MKYRSGLVLRSGNDQEAVTLRLSHFLVTGMLWLMFVNIRASPYFFGGGVIYFQFLKTDERLKVVIKA